MPSSNIADDAGTSNKQDRLGMIFDQLEPNGILMHPNQGIQYDLDWISFVFSTQLSQLQVTYILK
jgi:hypothetical protein